MNVGASSRNPLRVWSPHACAVHKYCAKRGFLTGEAEMRKKTGKESELLFANGEREGGKRRRKRLMAETESEMQRGCGTGLG